MKNLTGYEVILGTYEEYLLGYEFVDEENNVKQKFATHDHSSSVRCLAASAEYLASGGADDRIYVYNLKTNRVLCVLNHHNSTVNCLQFTPNHSHIISGSAGGELAIVRLGNWQLEKIWQSAHKGCAVLDIAIHSSGKLAVTLGADATLQTWNLIKGRLAYTINLNSKSSDAKSLEKISWAPCGEKFALTGGRYIETWSIATGGIIKSAKQVCKITCCMWFSENTLLAGCENGKLLIVDTNTNDTLLLDAHKSRVKGISFCKDLLATASSDGEFIVWTKELEQLARSTTGCRLICINLIYNMEKPMAATDDSPPTKKKRSKILEVGET